MQAQIKEEISSISQLFSEEACRESKDRANPPQISKEVQETQEQGLQIPILLSEEQSGSQAAVRTQKESHKGQKVLSIQIQAIVPNPNQPRKDFSESSILKLADSLRQFGMIQPITVRKLGHLFEVVAGERRLRAAKELGWSYVPCIVAEYSEEASAEVSIIENLIRQDLNMFEEAIAIEVLLDTYSLTQEEVAEKLSVSQSYIANKLRLLRFNQEEREIMLTNGLTERHARALLRISDQNKRRSALEDVIKGNLNVSQTENLVCYIINEENHDSVPKSSNSKQNNMFSFYNAINRIIGNAKSSNLDIKYRKIVGETFTELTIILPNIEAGDKK